MKRTFTLCILTLLSLFNTSGYGQDQLENGGFENWEDLEIKDTLNTWLSILGSFYPEEPNVTRIEDGFSGDAVRLETILNVDEEAAAAGIILASSFGGEDDFFPEGYPYDSAVDEFSAYLRYDIAPTDTGFALVILQNDGTPFSFATYPIYGTQETWELMTLDLGDPFLTPDAVTIAFFSSGDGDSEAVVGSWLEVDHVSFGNDGPTPDPIPNFSFEDWSALTIEVSNDWYSFDPVLASILGFQNISKSTDAYEGSFSAKIELFETNIAEGIYPYLSNGEYDFETEDIEGGTPFTSSPILYKGRYKLLSEGDDTASVYLRFWNDEGDLAEYADTLLFPANEWTAFSIPINLDFTPDSVLTILFGGRIEGTETFYDDIRFVYDDVSIAEPNPIKISAYPNPVSEALTIVPDQTADLLVTDMLGKTVYTAKVTTEQTVINTSEWPEGIYLVQVHNETEFNSMRVVVKH